MDLRGDGDLERGTGRRRSNREEGVSNLLIVILLAACEIVYRLLFHVRDYILKY